MKQLEQSEILYLVEYEKVRVERRREIVRLKQARRVSVGRYLTFVFENRATVWFQIQEMVRAERIVDESKIAEEIEVYNGLLPRPGELAATMMIEIAEPAEIKPVLDRLLGIDTRDYVKMTAGSHVIVGDFESGHSDEERGKLRAAAGRPCAVPDQRGRAGRRAPERARTHGPLGRDQAESPGRSGVRSAPLALLALAAALGGCSDSGLSPAAERGRPADQGLVARASRSEGAERDLSAGLHAEAPDEGDGADSGGGAGDRVAGGILALTRGAGDAKGPAAFRRAFVSRVTSISRI